MGGKGVCMAKGTHESFSLFKKQTPTGRVWYVKFWNAAAGKYAGHKSLGIAVEGKRERRRESEEAARIILPDIKFSNNTPEKYLDYVENFWTPDSPYCRASHLKKMPLSLSYIKNNHVEVGRHMRPFSGFEGITLQNLTAGLLCDWQLWASDSGMSERKINIVLQVMRVAVRYAVIREDMLLTANCPRSAYQANSRAGKKRKRQKGM
jgi:hypothetical protein